jgi:hypothetical protein
MRSASIRAFAEMIIPVEWREEHKSKLKTRETLVLTNHDRARKERRWCCFHRAVSPIGPMAS